MYSKNVRIVVVILQTLPAHPVCTHMEAASGQPFVTIIVVQPSSTIEATIFSQNQLTSFEQGKRQSKKSNDQPSDAGDGKNKQGQEKNPSKGEGSNKRFMSYLSNFVGITLVVLKVTPPKFPTSIPPQVPRTSQEARTYITEQDVAYIQSLNGIGKMDLMSESDYHMLRDAYLITLIADGHEEVFSYW